MSIRPIKSIIQSQPTIEGAGVKLRRAFGFGDTGEFDPFLLLDDFRNEHPEDYLAGFPWHPHRGIETITYVLSGTVQQGDSLGHRGALGAGDVQWMTAGSGILHQEMPKGDERGRMHGFQLWANLPLSLKMTDPRYQDVLVARIGHLERAGQVRPQLEPMHPAPLVALGHLLVENARARGHPLHVPGAQRAAVPQAIALLHRAAQDISDGFDTPVGVPGKAREIVLRMLVAEVIQ